MHRILTVSLAVGLLILLAAYGIRLAYQHVGDLAGEAVAAGQEVRR
jgi:hypothetical protein